MRYETKDPVGEGDDVIIAEFFCHRAHDVFEVVENRGVVAVAPKFQGIVAGCLGYEMGWTAYGHDAPICADKVLRHVIRSKYLNSRVYVSISASKVIASEANELGDVHVVVHERHEVCSSRAHTDAAALGPIAVVVLEPPKIVDLAFLAHPIEVFQEWVDSTQIVDVGNSKITSAILQKNVHASFPRPRLGEGVVLARLPECARNA